MKETVLATLLQTDQRNTQTPCVVAFLGWMEMPATLTTAICSDVPCANATPHDLHMQEASFRLGQKHSA